VDKFGKEFALQAMDNKGEVQIPEKVSRKLRVEPPSQELVESYLKEIAAAYDSPYGDEKAEEEAGVDEQDDNGDDDDDNDDNEPSSGGKAAAITPAKQKKKPTLSEPLSTQELSSMTPPRTLDPGLTSPIRIAPPSPSTDNANPKLRLPGTNGTVAAAAAGSSKVRPTSKVTPRSTVTASISAKKPEGAIPDVDDLESRFKMLKK
jgi:vacuolar protein sorting-associated protein IST1